MHPKQTLTCYVAQAALNLTGLLPRLLDAVIHDRYVCTTTPGIGFELDGKTGERKDVWSVKHCWAGAGLGRTWLSLHEARSLPV